MDIRTIFQISAIVTGSIFGFLLLVHRVTPALSGLSAVCSGFACASVGLGLVSLSGHAPDLLTITIAQIFLILVNVFFYLGVVDLLQLYRKVLWLGIVSVLPILTWNAWFTFVHPAQGPRIVVCCLILAFQNILLAVLVTRHGSQHTRVPRLCMGVLFYFWTAANLFNVGLKLLAKHPSIFQVTGSSNAIVVLVPVLDSILTVIAFLWLSTSKLQYSLEVQSRTDALTGLPDLRAIALTGTREIARARRAHTPLAAVLLDFDSFAAVNSIYGHDAGDFALSIAANYLTESVRSIDLVARYIGEKFVIFLPDTVGPVASEVAERLRNGLSEIVIRHNNKEFHIPASFGVTELTDDDLTWEDMLRRADHALHRAKDEGRNRTVSI